MQLSKAYGPLDAMLSHFAGRRLCMNQARRRALCTAALLITTPSLAAPWAEVGDKRLREDVELLMDVGIVPGPTLSWPLPWAQISEPVLAASQASDISPFLQAAARRGAAARHRV